mgnify:CR=1 FL=1
MTPQGGLGVQYGALANQMMLTTLLDDAVAGPTIKVAL